MKKFTLSTVVLSLALSVGPAVAQQPAPMNPNADGIPVTRLSRLRVFARLLRLRLQAARTTRVSNRFRGTACPITLSKPVFITAGPTTVLHRI